MIKHQTNGHGWKFMFLGANIDAVKEAESIGISRDCATGYTYNSKGVNNVYTTMSCVTSSVRGVADGAISLDGDFNLANAYHAVETNIDGVLSTEAKFTSN
jgi:hypothetical protein